MKKTFILITSAVLMFFVSCKENSMPDVSANDIEKNAREFLIKPDSLRTPEEKALFIKLQDIIYEKCNVEGGELVVNISKDEFKKMGVPEVYYDLLVKDIERINNFTDTTSIPIPYTDAFQESKERYLESKKLLR